MAEVAEAADAEVERLLEEMALIKSLGGPRLCKRGGRARHQREMRKADRACCHCLAGLRQLVELLSDGDPVGGRTTTHMAVQANPLDGRHRPLRFVFPRGREGRRHFRELELDKI